MSSAASNPSSASVNEHPLKRNSDDVGLKLHIAGKKGQVRSCPNATKEDKEKCLKAIEDSRKVKRARLEKQKEVVDDVCIDVPSDHEDNPELVEIGCSIPRAVGPMDNFTMPLDSSSMGSNKKLQQQKISEHVMKERLHKLKRYIAKWLYVRGLPFNSINCEEFDQMLEAAGRFGPGAKKPYQHELREKLLHEQVEDTKKMLKCRPAQQVSGKARATCILRGRSAVSLPLTNTSQSEAVRSGNGNGGLHGGRDWGGAPQACKPSTEKCS
ncbi:hypothetical protein E2562_017322 [Oryza meyeriana var. granulata]|uniref:Uncharacterized protein n=1 Tax=Oryza meyeriana var. granulata TaxID=110450 RepID=A0A6G1BYZ8_9ORYZ|nr:hypothetical protein E2562_017322 [Oryza meyeriana var. granulata]